MRELDDALKDLSDFESLVRNGLHSSKSLEKVEHEVRWDSLKFASLEIRIGQLKVEANAHAADGNGRLNIWVWDFNKPSGDACRFNMGADVDHAARVVVDCLNEYEVAA